MKISSFNEFLTRNGRRAQSTNILTSEQTLHASEIRYRRLFETAKDGILILDCDIGRINDVNPFPFNLLGFSRDEMLGKTVGELSPFKDIEENKVMLARLQKDEISLADWQHSALTGYHHAPSGMSEFLRGERQRAH